VSVLVRHTTLSVVPGNVMVVPFVPANVIELLNVGLALKVAVEPSTPANVSVLLTVRVLAFASVKVPVLVLIVKLLMLVAVATPRTGVTSVGEVASTKLPLPVWLVVVSAVPPAIASEVPIRTDPSATTLNLFTPPSFALISQRVVVPPSAVLVESIPKVTNVLPDSLAPVLNVGLSNTSNSVIPPPALLAARVEPSWRLPTVWSADVLISGPVMPRIVVAAAACPSPSRAN